MKNYLNTEETFGEPSGEPLDISSVFLLSNPRNIFTERKLKKAAKLRNLKARGVSGLIFDEGRVWDENMKE